MNEMNPDFDFSDEEIENFLDAEAVPKEGGGAEFVREHEAEHNVPEREVAAIAFLVECGFDGLEDDAYEVEEALSGRRLYDLMVEAGEYMDELKESEHEIDEDTGLENGYLYQEQGRVAVALWFAEAVANVQMRADCYEEEGHEQPLSVAKKKLQWRIHEEQRFLTPIDKVMLLSLTESMIEADGLGVEGPEELAKDVRFMQEEDREERQIQQQVDALWQAVDQNEELEKYKNHDDFKNLRFMISVMAGRHFDEDHAQRLIDEALVERIGSSKEEVMEIARAISDKLRS